MPTTPFKIPKGQLGFSLTDPGYTAAAEADVSDYSAFSCLITGGKITATQNFDTDEVPGTFCDPGAEQTVPKASTFALEIDALQDPQDDTVTGLAKFLYENDAGVSGVSVWFYLGLAENAAPKAIGKCFLYPIDFGGEPRVTLVGSLSFPCDGRPDLEFGTAANPIAAAAAADTLEATEPADDDVTV